MKVSAHDHVGLAWMCARKVVAATRVGSTRIEACELVSAAWLGIARAAERFDAARGVEFSTYASWYGIWRATECAQQLRTGRKRRKDGEVRVICASDAAPDENWADTVPDRHTASEALDADVDVRAVLAEMRPAERSAVELTVIGSLTLAQAATILGGSPQAVHQARQRGLRRAAASLLRRISGRAEARPRTPARPAGPPPTASAPAPRAVASA